MQKAVDTVVKLINGKYKVVEVFNISLKKDQC